MKKDDYLQIGAITQTHGIKGEVKVFPLTDDISRFKKGVECVLEPQKLNMTLTIENARPQKGLVIIKFKEFNDINQVEGLKKAGLYVTRENAVECEEGEYFIVDLIGLDVVTDEGETLGKITQVLQTGANDVYVVDMNGTEVLIPAIKQCILNVDIEKGEMLIHLLPGLID